MNIDRRRRRRVIGCIMYLPAERSRENNVVALSLLRDRESIAPFLRSVPDSPPPLSCLLDSFPVTYRAFQLDLAKN